MLTESLSTCCCVVHTGKSVGMVWEKGGCWVALRKSSERVTRGFFVLRKPRSASVSSHAMLVVARFAARSQQMDRSVSLPG